MHACILLVFAFIYSAALESRQLYHTVQGLLAFKAKTHDPQSLLASWNSSSMPCSTADCNSNKVAQDCNWAGIACQNGQVVALAVPCTVQSNGATGACALQGAPLDSLAQVSIVAFDVCSQLQASTVHAGACAYFLLLHPCPACVPGTMKIYTTSLVQQACQVCFCTSQQPWQDMAFCTATANISRMVIPNVNGSVKLSLICCTNAGHQPETTGSEWQCSARHPACCLWRCSAVPQRAPTRKQLLDRHPSSSVEFTDQLDCS